MTNEQLRTLDEIQRRLLWLACWTVHNANHLREKDDVKVGGHQASCASIVSIMTALYFRTLRPEDRVAVKPHASPVFHAVQYMAGRQTRDKLEAFRGYGGAQSYPSRTKDINDVDFSTGSVGLGVGITAFASIVQDYIAAKPWTASRPNSRMIALAGDAELDEGNIYECLQEGWKHDLRNCWWIIDYNRQSLDGVVREGLWERIEAIFSAFGWHVVRLKYGALQQSAFLEPGGQSLKDWIDRCPNSLYSALTYQGGAAWRARLNADIGASKAVKDLLDKRNDLELDALMNNLGGHCLETLTSAFDAIDNDRPTVFLAYTIKGWRTPLAGHKDNHAGLMNKTQMHEFQNAMGIHPGREWEKFEGLADPSAAEALVQNAAFFQGGERRLRADRIPVSPIAAPGDREISTQSAFGKILDDIARTKTKLAERIVTTSPDVTVSTNLGGWVNRRGLFARRERSDTFRKQNIPSTQKWQFHPDGQHIELGIAEMNLFLLLGAAGLTHELFGERLLPVGTVYDPFVVRGLDALNYACYQDARFMIAGTPSGITLSPEGGAHQSIGTPLIGMSQPGLASFEPAYSDELATIMQWGFEYLQHDGPAVPSRENGLSDAAGGSVYLRLSTRPVEQPSRVLSSEQQAGIIDGAYWMRRPGPNAEFVIVYQGCVAPEAIAAAGFAASSVRDVGVLAVTSSDRLFSGWTGMQKLRASRVTSGLSTVERLLEDVPLSAPLLTVIDGHPATLAWLGAVRGHRTAALGVEEFGQTGTIRDLYRHHGLDVDAMFARLRSLSPGRPLRPASGPTVQALS
jgi:pyruvate dehydrogenase E1 component